MQISIGPYRVTYWIFDTQGKAQKRGLHPLDIEYITNCIVSDELFGAIEIRRFKDDETPDAIIDTMEWRADPVYENCTAEEYGEAFVDYMQGVPVNEILGVPGVAEILREHYNNEVLANWLERERGKLE